MASAVTGILLAAGRGRRFDPEGKRNKLLQPLAQAGGAPVVVASARKLLAAVARVVAVVPPDDAGVAALLAGLGCDVVVCPDADSGMAASLTQALRHAVSAAPFGSPSSFSSRSASASSSLSPSSSPSAAPACAWLVALGDMPHVAPATLRLLADALAAGAPIVAPVLDGRRGNPVGFGAVHLDALLALRGDQGARRLLQTCPVTEIAVPDPGIFLDIDTPADLSPV